MDGVTHECPPASESQGAWLHNITIRYLTQEGQLGPKGSEEQGWEVQSSRHHSGHFAGEQNTWGGLRDRGTPCALSLPIQVTMCTSTPACWAWGAPLPGWRASTCLLLPAPACGSGTTWTSQNTSVSTAGAGRRCCPWGGHHEPMMGTGVPSPPTGPWTLVQLQPGGGDGPFLLGTASPGEDGAAGRAWQLLGGSRWPLMLGRLTPCVAASGELRVMLQSVSGQRVVWSVAGHRSRGWRGGVVPVQSSSEFQVSGVALGCRVPSPHISPPISHLPLQIIFEVTTQWWPMEGTVALDDIVYSTREGCYSSLEVPVEGVGPVLAVNGQTQHCLGCWRWGWSQLFWAVGQAWHHLLSLQRNPLAALWQR